MSMAIAVRNGQMCQEPDPIKLQSPNTRLRSTTDDSHKGTGGAVYRYSRRYVTNLAILTLVPQG